MQTTLWIESFKPFSHKKDHLSICFPLMRTTLLLCLLSLFFSCSNRIPLEKIYQRTQFLMGTLVEIKVVTDDPQEADVAMDRAFERMRTIEKEMTARHSGSWIERISREAVDRPLRIPAELWRVIDTCQRYAILTNGAFDITVGPITRLWQFDKPLTEIPKREDVDEALRFVGFSGIHLNEQEGSIQLDRAGMGLDLGGAAKGYAVDKAVAVLKDLGIKAGIVNAGGDLIAFGQKPGGKPWHIGIQDPEQSGRILGAILLKDEALVTSGDYERYIIYKGVKYHHIIDPKTGWPARGCKSVSVAYQNAFVADILSTALFVIGPEKGRALIEELTGVEGMIVDASNKIYISSGWKDQLNLQRNHMP